MWAPQPVRSANGLAMKVAIAPYLRADLAGQHLEEDEAIGRGQRVGILEIDFVLAVGVLVVGLVDAPVELAQARRSCRAGSRRLAPGP